MILLGSTGSIGTQALQIAEFFGKRVEVLSCAQNMPLLSRQILKFRPKTVVISRKNDAKILQENFKNIRILSGENGLREAIFSAESLLVMNAIVGFAGLLPSIFAMNAGKKLALANKESLVSGGFLFGNRVREIFPIDSEHFSLLQILNARKNFKNLAITSSGGALRDMPIDALKNAKISEVLAHPNWSMGAKITIDSATMANKIFEILECFWLFGTREISAFIERSSVLHALVTHTDHSTTAHFSNPSMLLPISHAIDPERAQNTTFAKNFGIREIGLPELKNLHFEEICTQRYPIFALKDLILRNPTVGVLINSANDTLNAAFARGEIGFLEISQGIFEALEHFGENALKPPSDPKTRAKIDENLGEILEFHEKVREFSENFVKKVRA